MYMGLILMKMVNLQIPTPLPLPQCGKYLVNSCIIAIFNMDNNVINFIIEDHTVFFYKVIIVSQQR